MRTTIKSKTPTRTRTSDKETKEDEKKTYEALEKFWTRLKN